jgi:hypothetical protein
MSESQERMMAVVEPANVDASWRSAPSGTSRPPSSARSPTPAGCHRLARRAVVDVPPRTVAHDGPVYERPFARPDLAGRPAGRRRRALPARRPATSCARRCCGWSPPRTCATSRGSPTSTTATSAATPCSRSPRTPAWSGSTRRPTSASRLDRLQRPLRQARPVRRRAARARRGLPQRRHRRREAAGRHRLPQLRLARGPGRHVAVRRGLPRPQADGCLELGIPVTGGNVSLYNQTGDDRDQPDAGGRRARRHRRRHPAHADRLRGPRARSCCCSARPATSSAARSGRTSCTAPRRPAAGGRPGAEKALAELLVDRPAAATGWSPRRTTCPTAASRRRWSSLVRHTWVAIPRNSNPPVPEYRVCRVGPRCSDDLVVTSRGSSSPTASSASGSRARRARAVRASTLPTAASSSRTTSRALPQCRSICGPGCSSASPGASWAAYSPSRRASTARSSPTGRRPASAWDSCCARPQRHRLAKRRPTRPTRGSKQRRLAGKKQRGEIKKGRQSRFD